MADHDNAERSEVADRLRRLLEDGPWHAVIGPPSDRKSPRPIYPSMGEAE